ncbi:CPBP family intramembrane metalloprotease [Massilia sp. PAMC28688]|uniref:CPBP family intramembrane glutamic endopeptidase n=1 Tax=Massilia sp. PAMC28688 TaxID=2861283 RepID=UPI001C62EA14|nr:CPBP family intramembrane glutamic endopeptidase [Massilia sp. PAMC28688]QYF93213.1 CPBP family intramembrane metalloprotease [Massilia sp. PAMC28688]
MPIHLIELNEYMIKNVKLRLGVTMWLLAMVGVVAVASTVIPQLLARSPQQVPLWIAVTASIVQSGVLLILAVWAGVTFSRPLGLGAPVIEAALSRSGAWLVLRDQIFPAAIVGIASGGVLLVAQRMSPDELLAVGQTITIPLVSKVLYGGIVEEVLVRWGLMTTLIWLPWRLAQKKAGPPQARYVVGAIIFSAVLFGLGHLPAAAAFIAGDLTAPVVAFVIVGNSLPGVMFGYLYWRYGIEAAMVAHAVGHVVFFLATGA